MPDSNKEILIPNNVLQIDISDGTGNEEMDVIRRQGKLYDKQEHSYTFDITDHHLLCVRQ